MQTHFKEAVLIDIEGQRFGKWLVIKRSVGDYPGTWWATKCDCGYIGNVSGAHLRKGQSTQCKKCASNSLKTHGQTKTKLFKVWTGMKSRCTAGNRDASNYYDRGIRVCPQWVADFSQFRAWALSNGYSHGLTIDRIDNSKDYTPTNCRWVPPVDQNRNQRRNVLNYTLVQEIRDRHKSGNGASISSIAKTMGLPYGAAYKAAKGLTWADPL